MARGEPYQVPSRLACWLADVHNTLTELGTEAADDRDTARVAAEQAIAGVCAGRIAQLPAGDPDSNVLVHVVRLLAYGHRHTIPGWDPQWAPDVAEVRCGQH